MHNVPQAPLAGAVASEVAERTATDSVLEVSRAYTSVMFASDDEGDDSRRLRMVSSGSCCVASR